MSGLAAIGVVGASARAAIHSIARAGLQGWAVDLFADRDLQQSAPSRLCPGEQFPDSLPLLAGQFPPGPVAYTGGLENHPGIVAQLAASRVLLGNAPEVLERVRDPHLVAAIPAEGIQHPRLVPAGNLPRQGRWLRKPLRSSSGHGIRFAREQETASPGHYFQEFIDGPSLSAIFASWSDKPEQTRLLGITEQIIGQPWLHAGPFAYCGNIGPVQLSSLVENHLLGFAAKLASGTGLRGLWGLDFILHNGRPFPVEVNPRYTAAIEVLELGGHLASIRLHCDCFIASTVPEMELPVRASRTIAKAIYFARNRLVFPDSGRWDDDLATPRDPWRVPGFADIPAPRTIIAAGHPVLTFFAAGRTPEDCRADLRSQAAELDGLFSEYSHHDTE